MDINLPMPPCPRQRRPRCVIIGGGFSGAAVALNLLEMRDPAGPEIIVIEPRAWLGAGLAYSAPDPAHRVNVPAARLLVHPEEPGAFNDWLEHSGALREDPAAQLPDGRRYPRRAVFGRYVHARLMQAAQAPGAAPFRHIRARAVSIHAHGAGYRITLDDGALVLAGTLVLAVSHPPPAVPAALDSVAGTAKFIADPWAPGLLQTIAPDDRVLIIGTALSTADIIGSLDAAGRRNRVLAISRRGLVSRARRLTQNGPFGDFSTQPSRSAVSLLQAARRAIAQAEASGSCWEAVIEALRNQGDHIWAALPEPERRRFLRHLRPYWDVHRYQLAPQLAETMRRKAAAGELRIAAARVTRASFQAGQFRITLRLREVERTETVEAVINCTGPNHANITRTNPALASLAQAGLLRADPHGLGIQTDMSARPLNAAGQPTPNLFIAGPLARAAFGELMGLPQVSHHAALVASLVAEHSVVGA